MCFFKLADIYVITDLCKHFTFLYLYSYLFEKIKKIYLFCTLYFIFKILTYKKNSKPIGENSSLVTFFLTTWYHVAESNCVFFAYNLFSKFANVPYPIEPHGLQYNDFETCNSVEIEEGYSQSKWMRLKEFLAHRVA